MSDGIKALSEVSGLASDDIKGLMAEVKTNFAKLDACPGPHDFEAVDRKPLPNKYRCKVCGGEVDGHAAHWYRKGLEHGGSEPRK